MIGKMLQPFARLMAGGADKKGRGPLDDFWYEPVNLSSLPFTLHEAEQLSVTQDCLATLANPVATLPLHIFRRDSDGNRVRVDNHPLTDILTKQANDSHTAFEFKSFMQWQLGWHKNALAEIAPGPRGAVDRLIPYDWANVSIRKSDGRRFFDIRLDDGSRKTLRDDEVWHLRAPPFTGDGLQGRPIYETGRRTLAYAIAVHNYGAMFFVNSGKSGGIIKMPGSFATAEEREKFTGAWTKARTGANAHRDRVLEFGADYLPQEVKNNEAQFRESKIDANRAVGRLWNVPPHKLGDLDNQKFNTVEQQGIGFVQDVLLPWLTLWEQAILRDLIIADRVFFAEFDIAGMLKGDLKSRFESYAKAIQWGWMTVNEVRRKENLDPVQGGDVILRPLNMGEAGAENGDSEAAARADARTAALTVLREREEKEAA